MVADEDMTLNQEEFAKLMQEQKVRAREARKALGDLAWAGIDLGLDNTPTTFVGYSENNCEARVLAVCVGDEVSGTIAGGESGIIVLDKTPFYAEMGGQVADHENNCEARVLAVCVGDEVSGTIAGGESGIIVLDKTPFYAEMGGQVADQGLILMGSSRFQVTNVQKDKGGKYLHYGNMVSGSVKVDDVVLASIDVERRKAIMRAHSATHLLHKALQSVLGDHVHQAGSYVEPDRLRFDFTHYSALTAEELAKVKSLVQNAILEGYTIDTREVPIEDAKAMGATALFSEKYGDTVRVVNQAGSYVEPDRLRFDFTHYSALTAEELAKVKSLVQNAILEGYTIDTREVPIEDAKAMGATALFSEKYGDTVRVVNMGNYSIELCGGTHLDNTAKVGPFELESEGSVSSGVRRIEAITGKVCLEKMERSERLLIDAAMKLKAKPAELAVKIQTHLDELKELRRVIEQYKAKEASGEVERFLFGSHNMGGYKVLTVTVPNADAAKLRQMGDLLREKDPKVVAVLASIQGDKPTFLAVCGKEAVAGGIKAGELVKQVCCCCGGSGGGKPDSAMGGGKDVTKVDNALALVDDYVASKLS